MELANFERIKMIIKIKYLNGLKMSQVSWQRVTVKS